MTTKELSIELKSLTKKYGELTVVESLDLEIKKGEFFALLGSSGSGKTTTLRMIAGLETPNSGEIFLNGKNIEKVHASKREVNTVFQNYALFPHMTVFENVAFGLRRKGMKNIDERVMDMLARVQLQQKAQDFPDQLSGGQKQRVALARALVNNPEALLLDEPLGALDMRLRRSMQYELRQMQKNLGLTFVHVTHDQEEAMSMADRVAVMSHGKIVQIGTPEELYNNPNSAFVASFLGESNLIPATRASGTGVTVLGRTITLKEETIHSQNKNALLGIRPEKVTLAHKDAKQKVNAITLQGIVKRRSFHGTNIHYLLETAEGVQLQSFEQNSNSVTLSPGDKAEIIIDGDESFLVDYE